MGDVVAQWETLWLNGRRGGSTGDVVAQWETWWLNGRRGGSMGDVVAQLGDMVAQW